ncbi:MAG: DUF3267 domain-containing protein [Anaerolineaceae bacterium]
MINKNSSYQALPEGYQKTYEFNLKKDIKLLLGLNLIGFVLLILCFNGLAWYGSRVRPADALEGFSGSIEGTGGVLVFAGLLLLVIVLMVLLHEAVHGLFFWIFTHRRPVFAVRLSYAYAAAPGCYLPRGRYSVLGLAPLVILTVISLALIPFVPSALLFFLILFTALNFAGAVGDIWVVGRLLWMSPAALIQDFGDRIEVYEPSGPA